jgi:hypothetical protein
MRVEKQYIGRLRIYLLSLSTDDQVSECCEPIKRKERKEDKLKAKKAAKAKPEQINRVSKKPTTPFPNEQKWYGMKKELPERENVGVHDGVSWYSQDRWSYARET